MAVFEVVSRLHFKQQYFVAGTKRQQPAAIFLKQMEDRSGGKKSFKTTKVPYSSWKISCRLSLSFSSVFPSNAFQNILKHNTIFLTQQNFVLWFVFLRNHVI